MRVSFKSFIHSHFLTLFQRRIRRCKGRKALASRQTSPASRVCLLKSSSLFTFNTPLLSEPSMEKWQTTNPCQIMHNLSHQLPIHQTKTRQQSHSSNPNSFHPGFGVVSACNVSFINAPSPRTDGTSHRPNTDRLLYSLLCPSQRRSLPFRRGKAPWYGPRRLGSLLRRRRKWRRHRSL